MHRFEPHLAPIVSVFGSFVAGLLTLFSNGFVVVGVGIIDNRTLLFACLVGACGGSLASLIFFPPRDPSVRWLASKFLGSGIVSVIFSPHLIHWMKADPDPEFVLFVSGAVGMCGFMVATAIRRWVAKRAGDFLNEEDMKDGK